MSLQICHMFCTLTICVDSGTSSTMCTFERKGGGKGTISKGALSPVQQSALSWKWLRKCTFAKGRLKRDTLTKGKTIPFHNAPFNWRSTVSLPFGVGRYLAPLRAHFQWCRCIHYNTYWLAPLWLDSMSHAIVRDIIEEAIVIPRRRFRDITNPFCGYTDYQV